MQPVPYVSLHSKPPGMSNPGSLHDVRRITFCDFCAIVNALTPWLVESYSIDK